MITATVDKESVASLLRKLKESIPKAESGVQKEIIRLALKMTGKVMGKLSGDVLKVRTGRLRRSIHPEWEFKSGYSGAIVGTNVEYAATHEYGLKGTVQVKSFQREMTKAFGKPVAPKQVTVSAHSRIVNMPERSFLRSALREMEPEIIEGLRNAVKKEMQGITKK